MRTKVDIRKKLSDSLVSAAWKRLKNAVIGKELISWGTEVIYNVDAINQAFVDSLNPDTADLAGLINLSKVYGVVVSVTKPSWVQVKLPEGNKVFKPFDIVATSGSCAFTNIQYCKSGDIITLYQGNVKAVVSSGASVSDFFNFRLDKDPDTLEVSYESTGILTSRPITILGSCIPDSVFYCKQISYLEAKIPSIINRYTYNQFAKDVETFKLETLSDGSIAVVYGDDIWAKAPDDSKYAIFFLQPDYQEFEQVLDFSSTEFGNLTDVVVIASGLGEASSVSYVQEQLKGEIADRAVVATAAQIRDFSRRIPFVQDVKVAGKSRFSDEIDVYVKPVDKNAPQISLRYPAELQIALSYRIPAGMKLNCLAGSLVIIQLNIIANTSDLIKNQIQNAILDKYAYSKMLYDSQIRINDVIALIHTLFGVLSSVTLRIIKPQSSNSGSVGFTILENTFKIHLENDMQAIERNGIIFGPANNVTNYNYIRSSIGLCAVHCAYKLNNNKYTSSVFDLYEASKPGGGRSFGLGFLISQYYSPYLPQKMFIASYADQVFISDGFEGENFKCVCFDSKELYDYAFSIRRESPNLLAAFICTKTDIFKVNWIYNGEFKSENLFGPCLLIKYGYLISASVSLNGLVRSWVWYNVKKDFTTPTEQLSYEMGNSRSPFRDILAIVDIGDSILVLESRQNATTYIYYRTISIFNYSNGINSVLRGLTPWSQWISSDSPKEVGIFKFGDKYIIWGSDNNGSVKVVLCEGFVVGSSEVSLKNPKFLYSEGLYFGELADSPEIPSWLGTYSGTLSGMYFNPLYLLDDSLVFNVSVNGSGTPTGVKTYMMSESSIVIKEVPQLTYPYKQVGSVNAEEGTFEYTPNVKIKSVEFESITALDNNEYQVLNEEEPIIWK